MPPLEIFWDRFGIWVGFALYVFIAHGIPFLRDKFWPQYVKQEADRRKSESAREKLAEEERRLWINEISEERRWHRQVDAERLEEMKKLVDTVNAIHLNLVQLAADSVVLRAGEADIVANQRIIIEKQDDHHTIMMDKIGEMEKEVARRTGLEQGRLIPRTGPITSPKEDK